MTPETNTKQLRVLYFHTLRQIVGVVEEEVRVPLTACVGDVLDHLIGLRPELEQTRPSLLVAVNQEWAGPDDPVDDGAEVALMPPVSGG